MRPPNNDFLLRSGDFFKSSEGPALSFADIPGALRRRWRFLVFGSLIGLTLAVSYIVFATPLYTSTARILIDRSMNQNLQTDKIVDDRTPIDSPLVDSQVHVLASESIVLPVVKSMNLAHESEFVGPPATLGARILWQIKELLRSVKNSIGLNDDSTVDATTFLERTAVETFLSRLTPTREDLTYVIDIAFASEDPNKAARIANAVADTYIASTLEAKYESTKMASKWLQDRLIELKVQATDADRALQHYKSENNIVETGRGFLNQEQLSDLNTQLINARAATAEAKARVDRIRQISNNEIPGATVTDALNNSVITRLRAQYLDEAARAADLTARVGQQHFTVVKLHEQMEELRKSIRNEEQRIADAYASDYEIALARERSLTDSMSRLIGEAEASSQARVTMRDLESSADTYRNLYNSYLQKFQETIQSQTIPVTDARIITRATAPLHKSTPKTALSVAWGIMLGLVVGAGAAMAQEMRGDVFRTPKEVEQTTGMRCLGILPIVASNRKQALLFDASIGSRRATRDKTEGAEVFVLDAPFSRFTKTVRNVPALPVDAGIKSRCSTADTSVEEFVLDAPFSRFAETLRNVKVSINTEELIREVKVVGVVSSVAKEGKTTVAANLAALMIASSGSRTLIVDGDFHQRSLSAKLAPEAREGLIEALSDPSRLATLVCHRQRSGLDVLPCVLENRIPNAAELLGSPQMEQLLAAARQTYDYVIIELAPIVSVVDVKVIERFIDSFVFVTEWGRSKRHLVLEALSDAQIIRERLLGIVLNKADPFSLQSLEAYKGDTFRSYYRG